MAQRRIPEPTRTGDKFGKPVGARAINAGVQVPPGVFYYDYSRWGYGYGTYTKASAFPNENEVLRFVSVSGSQFGDSNTESLAVGSQYGGALYFQNWVLLSSPTTRTSVYLRFNTYLNSQGALPNPDNPVSGSIGYSTSIDTDEFFSLGITGGSLTFSARLANYPDYQWTTDIVNAVASTGAYASFSVLSTTNKTQAPDVSFGWASARIRFRTFTDWSAGGT